MKKIALAILALALTACSNVSLPMSKREIIKQEFDIFNQNELLGREFIVETENYKDKKITIGFSKNRIYGFGGANRYFGTYKIENNKLIIDKISVSKGSAKRENELAELAFITALKDNKEIKLEEPYLILNSNEDFNFKFKDINFKEEVTEVKK